MSILEQLETDPKKENEGVAIEFPPNKDGSIPTFIIAATSRANQKYAKELERVTRPYKGNLSALGNEGAERLFREVFAKTVLKGWKNVKEKDGTEIPYSYDAAIKLLERLPRLYDKLSAEAAEIENFKAAVREDESGN